MDLLNVLDALILAAQIAPRWSRDQAGTIGDAIMTAGISCQMLGHNPAQFDLHHSHPGDRHDRIPSTRGMMQRDPQMSSPIEVADSIGTSEQLIIARQAAPGTLQWFGLIEPAQITTGGHLSTDDWAGGAAFDNAQLAAQWERSRFGEPKLLTADTQRAESVVADTWNPDWRASRGRDHRVPYRQPSPVTDQRSLCGI